MSLQQAAQELVDRLEIAAVAWHRQHRQDDEVAHCNHQSCQRNKAAINGGREALAQSGEREALSITHVPQVEQNYLSRGSG